MDSLTLNVFSRLNLEALIRSQKTEDHEELLLLCDLRNKVGYDDTERSVYVRSIPGMAPEIKLDVARKATPFVVELEKAELRKVAALVRPMKVTTDDASEWYLDLRKQLLALGVW